MLSTGTRFLIFRDPKLHNMISMGFLCASKALLLLLYWMKSKELFFMMNNIVAVGWTYKHLVYSIGNMNILVDGFLFFALN